jgi:hypothetical protein
MNLVFLIVVSLLDKGIQHTCKLVGRGGLSCSTKKEMDENPHPQFG